jgi:CheY-like chemotaxis protein
LILLTALRLPAITLDVKLPDTSGWKVLDMLKNDLNYRHIPIYLVSGEENSALALKRGARSFLLKPLDNESINELFADIVFLTKKGAKKILLVEDNEIDSSQIAKMMTFNNLNVILATTGKKAIQQLGNKDFDCIILDYTLPDISGTELVNKVGEIKNKITPVIVYSARDFDKIELGHINRTSSTVLLKGVNSLENLMEESVMHLHLNHKELPPEKQRIIESIRIKNDILTGKNILVVDDDVRNLFALTTVFERLSINTVTAESGKKQLR